MVITGGEFTVLDDYPDLLVALSMGRDKVRLTTNGSWSNSDEGVLKFTNTLTRLNEICNEVEISVSTDSWHSGSGKLALDILKEFSVFDIGEIKLQNVAPVGRAWDNLIMPPSIAFTHSCKRISFITVIESGLICKCPYGYFAWENFIDVIYEEAKEYVDSWRSRKLQHRMNCRVCMEELAV